MGDVLGGMGDVLGGIGAIGGTLLGGPVGGMIGGGIGSMLGGSGDSGSMLGGIGDFLLGNDETVEAHQSGTATRMTPEQIQLLSTLLGQVQAGVQGGITPYQGQRAAGEAPIQSQVFSKVNQLLGGSNFESAMADALSRPEGSTFDKAGTQDFYNQAIYAPAMRKFMDETAPAIQEKYVSQNALESGGYNRALTKAAGEMTTAGEAQLANLLFSSQEAQKGRDFTAGESYRNRALTATDLLTQLGLQSGATQRGITQEGLTAGQQKWTEAQPYNNPYLNYALSLLDKQQFQPIIQEGYATDEPGFFDYASGGLDIITGLKGAGGLSNLFKGLW